jgi:hypothetical protein
MAADYLLRYPWREPVAPCPLVDVQVFFDKSGANLVKNRSVQHGNAPFVSRIPKFHISIFKVQTGTC